MGEPRDVPVPNVGTMKVRDLEVREKTDRHLVTVWDNACIYTNFVIGQTIKLKDVLSGYNKFHQRNNVIIRYEDQIEVCIIILSYITETVCKMITIKLYR